MSLEDAFKMAQTIKLAAHIENKDTDDLHEMVLVWLAFMAYQTLMVI